MRLIKERRHLELPSLKKMASDDDDIEVELTIIPDLTWSDNNYHNSTLLALNQMRKNKQFCDVTLQIGKQDIPAHRVVLAAASPYLFDLFTSEDDLPTQKEEGVGIIYELNGGFDKEALERLIEYAYTGTLQVVGDKVNSIYAAAIRLKMDRVAEECARFLSNNLALTSCLDTRSLTGIISSKLSPGLVSKVDDYISSHLPDLRMSRELRSLPRICLEILHSSKDELDAALIPNLCQLSLDWIHQQWNEDENLTIESLVAKNYLLFIAGDNTLQDCEQIQEGAFNDSELIQDYKKINQSLNVKGIKSRRIYSAKPAKPRELLFSRHINQHDETPKSEDRIEDWKMIACMNLVEGNKKSILGIVTVDGRLATLSIIQRVNSPNSNPSTPMLSTSTSPRISRPPSVERDEYEPVSNMSQAKCAVGAASMNNKLVVCGGYDRGECLNNASLYDPLNNDWTKIEPMNEKRGRFDITVTDNCIYAIAGSNGQSELRTAEKYEMKTGKWNPIGNLPISLCNIGRTWLWKSAI